MAKQLLVGESQTVIVDPALHYSPTGLLVFPYEEYEFTAEGNWADSSIICDANGWIKWYLAGGIAFNRVRFQRYFLLCGNFAKQESTNFIIGSYRNIQIPDYKNEKNPFELFLFANDICSMYGNNRELGKDDGGPMRVTIVRKI